jgi:hypothetical protein
MKKIKGSLLPLTLMVMAAVFLFGFMFLYFYRTDRDLEARAENDLVALEAAGAGIQDALYQLKKNPRWNDGFPGTTLPRSGAAYTMSFNPGQAEIPYSTNNFQGTAAVIGSGGRPVPAGMIHLVSIGIFGKSRKKEEALVLASAGSPFTGAAFVNRGIELQGNVLVDSWDSSRGSYVQTRLESGGNIGTNMGTDGIVELQGSVTVAGNISLGTGGTPSGIRVSGGSTYLSYSVSSPRTFPFQTPPPSASLGNVTYGNNASAVLAPGTYDNLNLSGGASLQLQSGNYTFNGNIEISGNSQLLLPENGQSVLYTAGNISLTGNSISNTARKPGNLVIFGGPSTTGVEINGNGSAYMALYAPAAEVNITGNASIYGAVVAGSLNMQGNGGIHFDRSLSTMALRGSGAVTVRARW